MHKNKGKIMTVTGAIEPDELGFTLSHEHLVIDLSKDAAPSADPEQVSLYWGKVTQQSLQYLRYNPFVVKENSVIKNSEEDISFLTHELNLYAKVGGNSLVDMTLDGFGRDVVAAKLLSENTGVHIISGCGNYVKTYHPPYVASLSEDQLAQKYIDEINNGIDKTGIKPGILGELGTSNVLFADEIKVLRAAAKAQSETGLPINVHIPCSTVDTSHQILSILKDAGADLEHVVLSHRCGCLVYPNFTRDEALDYLASLADRGCYVEFDLAGCIYPYFTPNAVLWHHADDRDRAYALLELCKRGYSEKLLLSHDAAYRFYYTTYGGWAPTHISTVFKKILQVVGLPDSDFDNFMINNPKHVFTIF